MINFVKRMWAKWRAWATIDDTIEALIDKHFSAAVAFEQHAEKKFDEMFTNLDIAQAAQALATAAEAEANKASDIAKKVRSIFS